MLVPPAFPCLGKVLSFLQGTYLACSRICVAPTASGSGGLAGSPLRIILWVVFSRPVWMSQMMRAALTCSAMDRVGVSKFFAAMKSDGRLQVRQKVLGSKFSAFQ